MKGMKTTLGFLFFHAFFVSTFLSSLSLLISRQMKTSELKHLAEFWLSLAVMMVVSFIFAYSNDAIVGISMLGWLWPLKAMFQMVQDMSGARINYRLISIILGVGALLSLILASYGLDFIIFTAPFSLAYGISGLIAFRNITLRAEGKYSVLGQATYILLSCFILLRVTFPLWRLSEYNLYGAAANLLVLIGLGASTLAFCMELFKVRHEHHLKSVIKERNDQLLGQSKYAELGMMSAGIAHEINNPLAIIQAKTTQLLRVHRQADKAQFVSEGLEQILYTSERINRTIRGVRDFVHQEEHIDNERIELKNLVDDVLAFCGQRMKNHGINLRFYGLENYYVRGHKIQLEQVLLNLLNNSFDAIEFLPDKWIEMSAHETPHSIQIYFKDSGPGIPPEIASRMMEPFYSTKKMGKGTGLGLALARGIAEKHGGSLVYLSQANHTTFMLELPKDGMPMQRDRGDEQPTMH